MCAVLARLRLAVCIGLGHGGSERRRNGERSDDVDGVDGHIGHLSRMPLPPSRRRASFPRSSERLPT